MSSRKESSFVDAFGERSREKEENSDMLDIFGGLSLSFLRPPGSSSSSFASKSEASSLAAWAQNNRKQTSSVRFFGADLPGLKEEEEEHDKLLSLITGERSREKEEKCVNWGIYEGFPLRSSPFVSFEEFSSTFIRIERKETPSAHIIHVFLLPMLKKEEVKVELEDGRIVQVSAESSGKKFLRRFGLPKNLKVDELKASMQSQFLLVTVPKEEEKQQEMKNVRVIEIS